MIMMTRLERLEDMNVMRRLALKLITKVQKRLLKSDKDLANSAYYALARLHFKLFFRTSLDEAVLDGENSAHQAAKRHARLVVGALYPNSSEEQTRTIKAAARGSFTKNIILTAKV